MKIVFDYRFDTNGFFNNSARRQALEKAADIWENIINDDFDNIPAGIKFTINNPENAATENITLTSEIDDLLIFVASRNIAGSAIARAGYDGVDASGDIFSARISNNFRNSGAVTNFEPWVGTMYFDTDPSINWDFSLVTPDPSKTDFISIALHEMGHIFGIGTSPIFKSLGNGAFFNGVNSRSLNGGNPVPLETNLAHVKEGFNNNTILLDPIYNGNRNLPTNFDLALLADIGYEISGFTTQGTTPPIVTQNNDVTVFGTILNDVIDGLGGNDQIQGDDGKDTLLGNTGSDLLFGGNGDDSLLGGNDHDQLQGGNNNDILKGEQGNDTLFGEEGNDLLEGGNDHDQLQGGNNNDTLEGGTGNDTLFGQNGQDQFIFNLNSGKDNISDFTVSEDKIVITSQYGFTTPNQILNAITSTGDVINNPPHSRFSVISLTTQDEITVFHDNNLTANNFIISNSNPSISLDIDGNGQYSAAVDGLLFYGYMNIRNLPSSVVNNLTQQLANNLIPPNSGATRTTGSQIVNYLESDRTMMDVDGDGAISAAIDGLITYGYLNIRNLPSSVVNTLTQQLANNLIPDNSTAIRDTGAEISTFLESYIF
jgi:hypothetical protein